MANYKKYCKNYITVFSLFDEDENFIIKSKNRKKIIVKVILKNINEYKLIIKMKEGDLMPQVFSYDKKIDHNDINQHTKGEGGICYAKFSDIANEKKYTHQQFKEDMLNYLAAHDVYMKSGKWPIETHPHTNKGVL